MKTVTNLLASLILSVGKGFGKGPFPFFLLLVMLAALFGCQVNEEIKRTVTIKPKDDLTQFDSVQLEIKRLNGEVLLTRNLGKIDSPDDLKGIEVPGFDGGQIILTLRGFEEGRNVYAKQFQYNGINQTVLQTSELPIQSPVQTTLVSLTLKPESLAVALSDTLTRLTLATVPTGYETQVRFTVAPTQVLEMRPNGTIHPLLAGSATVRATSTVDSTKFGEVKVRVFDDMPVLSVGQDTVVVLGSVAFFSPKVVLTNATLLSFEWDLDGDSVFEGLGSEVKPISAKFDKAGEWTLRFRVRDSRGRQVVATQGITVVDGLAVYIVSPRDSAVVNTPKIVVHWTVNGTKQNVDTVVDLQEGRNVIVRSAVDILKRTFTDSAIVFLDTTPPQSPKVDINNFVTWSSSRPTWTWIPATPNETGIFRLSLDSADAVIADSVKDLSFKPPFNLEDGVHTLYVSERDSVGNWSVPGSAWVRIDATPPNKPDITVKTVDFAPKWKVTSGGGGIGLYRVAIDDPSLSLAPKEIAIQDSLSLFEFPFPGFGEHVLYVAELDSVMNLSAVAQSPFTISPPSGSLQLGGAVDSGWAEPMKLAFSSQGTPYVLYVKQAAAQPIATVKRFDPLNGSWVSDNGAGWEANWFTGVDMVDDGKGRIFAVVTDPNRSNRPRIMQRLQDGWKEYGDFSAWDMGTDGKMKGTHHLLLAAPSGSAPQIIHQAEPAIAHASIPDTGLPVQLWLERGGPFGWAWDAIYDSTQKRIVMGTNDGGFATEVVKFWAKKVGSTEWSQLGAGSPYESRSRSRLAVHAGRIFRYRQLRSGTYETVVEAYDELSDKWNPILAPLVSVTPSLSGSSHPEFILVHPNGKTYIVYSEYYLKSARLMAFDPSRPDQGWKPVGGIDLSGLPRASVMDARIGPDGKIYVALIVPTITSNSYSLIVKRLDP